MFEAKFPKGFNVVNEVTSLKTEIESKKVLGSHFGMKFLPQNKTQHNIKFSFDRNYA